MDRGTPIQRETLTRLNRLNYIDDDVLFNTIKMGLNKGYNEYLRRRNFPPSNLTEREIVQHIINHDPRAVVNDLENYYKDYYINYMDISGGLKNLNVENLKRRREENLKRRREENLKLKED